MIIRNRARHLLPSICSQAEEAADFEQDLALQLFIAEKRFDPSRSNAATFASRVTANKVANILEADRAAKRRPRSPLPPQTENLGDTEVVDIADLRAVQREREHDDALRLDVAEVVAKLPPHHQDLCHLLMDSSLTHVAEASGRSRSGVYDSIAKMRVHFERAGLRAYLADESSTSPVCTGRRRG